MRTLARLFVAGARLVVQVRFLLNDLVGTHRHTRQKLGNTLPQFARDCYGSRLLLWPVVLGECKMSGKSILPLCVALLFVAGTTAKAQPRPRPCAIDIKAYCTDVVPGEGRIAACIKEHLSDFSPACKARLITVIVTTKECAADVKGRCTGTSKEATGCLATVLPDLSNLCKTAILAATLRSR